MQNIDDALWSDFQTEQQKAKEQLIQISNSGQKPQTKLMRDIVSRINISDLAKEYHISECPNCHRNLYFDDSAGLFICYTQRFKKKKCFAGGIIDFMEFCLR